MRIFGMRFGVRASVMFAFVLLASLVPSAPASAQATRTWVSGVGDDVNPCSRTAPCKTFAGAISKTFTGGEIDVLDPGGFGAVNITKSITIDGGGFMGSVLASGVSSGIGINIAPNANDPHRKVVLRNLSVNGTGARGSVGTNTGVRGINIHTNGADSVRIENVRVFNFQTCGICMQPAASPSDLTVVDSIIADNILDGVTVSPGTRTRDGSKVRVTLRDTRIYGNEDAIQVTRSAGPNRVEVHAYGNVITDNRGIGVRSDGPYSRIYISDNDIMGNRTGLRSLSGGDIVSYGDNRIRANALTGPPTSIIDKT